MALTNVPSLAQCIRITATPSSGSATAKTFAVTAGSTSANLQVGKLLPGSFTITGDAFNVACASIGGVGDWLADPVNLTIKAGSTPTITLTFRKNNPLTVSANFVNNVLSASLGPTTSYVATDVGLVASGEGAVALTFTRMNFNNFDSSSVPGNSVAQLATTAFGACALRADKTVWCWGSSNFGELGAGIAVGATASSPVQVPGLTNVTQIAGGLYHACAIGTYASKSGVFCWGRNNYGQLGNGNFNDGSTPVIALYGPAKALGCGGYTSFAIDEYGTTYGWGLNSYGQLGNGTTTASLIPGGITYLAGISSPPEPPGSALAVGRYHTCLLRVDGSVRCWGYNAYGQLGNGTTTNSSYPVAVTGLSARQISSSSGYHTCAISTSGQAVCWGYNADGELGDASSTSRSVPTAPLLNGVTLTTIATGSYHTCGITGSSDLYCWGANDRGQLGDGTQNYAFLPIKPQLQ